jgi:hypothetical protein
MGTTTVITSDAVTQLEADVTELTAKLNGVITQYNLVQADMTTNKTAIDSLKTQFNLAESDLTNHKGKIDTLITDVEDINDKISDGYTPATSGSNHGTSGDSILLRLERLDTDFVNLDNRLQGHMAGNYTSTQVHNVGSPGSGRTGGSSDNLNGITALGTPTTGAAADNSSAITAGTADQSASTASASVTPSYTTGATKVITLGAKGEVRARKLARQTLNRLRK